MKYLLFTWALVVLCGCQNSSSGNSGGNEGPNGGDQVAQQAASLVSDVVAIVESNAADFPEIKLADFKAAAARAKIIRKDRTYANGVETDAANNGFDTIELNGARWSSIESDRRLALIFHELLGCIGLEINGYYISSRLLNPENRFSNEQTVRCSSLVVQGECALSLRYDRVQKALVLTDISCGHFAQQMNFFYKQNRRLFSIDKPCVDPDEPPSEGPQTCSSHSPPMDLWAGLSFLDGGRFFFTGYFREYGQVQMGCGSGRNL